MRAQFTFPDGAFRYDCARCRARCCKGLGIGLDAARARRLAERSPGLLGWMRAAGGGEIVAQNVHDGCWFLDDAGLCALETEAGREAKPAACRLFPFNRIYRVGKAVVVDVNSYLCPIEDAAGEGVTHAELRADFESLQHEAAVGRATPPEGMAPEVALEREARILTCCSEALARGASDYVQVVAQAIAPASTTLESWRQLRELAAACLGIHEALAGGASATTARLLILLTPSLRFNYLFRRPAETDRRHRSGEQVMRMLAVFELLLRSTQRLGRRPLSLRAVTELWQARAPALAVLARLDQRPMLDAAGMQLDTDAPEALQGPLYALAGLAAANRSGGRTLAELLEQVAPDPFTRTLLLPYAASVLGGTI